jgi:hypothetical protein
MEAIRLLAAPEQPEHFEALRCVAFHNMDLRINMNMNEEKEDWPALRYFLLRGRI